MEIIFYLLAPITTLLYKFLDYKKLIDKISGRELRISGLKRLESCTGFPDAWIYNDSKDSREFNALIKSIIKKNDKLYY